MLSFPNLKKDLRMAHLPYNPAQYLVKSLKLAALFAITFTILFFFVLQKSKLPLLFLIPIFIILYLLIFQYSMLTVRAKIRKREHMIDREVLFVGRHMLVKIYSGRPLLNALIETANSRGIASKYIKEIVDDINTGSTIEDALNNAIAYTPSSKLRKILFQINNALQLGIDVTKPLESVLEEITKEEQLEIQKYGKKLNTLVILYMLAAVILPSLGTSMFIVIASFISIPIDIKGLLVFTFFIVVLQFIFITLFRSIRPVVDL